MEHTSDGMIKSSRSWTDAYKDVPLGLLSWQERLRKFITGERRLASVLTGARIWI